MKADQSKPYSHLNLCRISNSLCPEVGTENGYCVESLCEQVSNVVRWLGGLFGSFAALLASAILWGLACWLHGCYWMRVLSGKHLLLSSWTELSSSHLVSYWNLLPGDWSSYNIHIYCLCCASWNFFCRVPCLQSYFLWLTLLTSVAYIVEWQLSQIYFFM